MRGLGICAFFQTIGVFKQVLQFQIEREVAADHGTVAFLANQTARVSDPTQTGRRPRVQGELPAGAPLIIHYVVRKPLTPKRAKRAYQTDYVQRWND